VPQLTPEQQKQQNSALQSGRSAYRANFTVTGNPYSKQPLRDLWDKGWRLEKKKEDATRQPRDHHRTPFKKPGDPNTKHRQPKQSERRQPTGRPTETQPVAMTDKLAERFNRRHQTRA
jgi:hypothetical protein